MGPRLCLINAQDCLADAFRAAGCTVLRLSPQGEALFDLPAELAKRGFTPDLVFQQERLGPRTLLSGLERISAARAFWAIDPHLNAFWHAPYARLFDVVFTTQRRWSAELRACGAASPVLLPWYAPLRPFTPFARRRREAGFVGRLGPMRPSRAWLAALMERLLPGRFEVRGDLSHEAMFDFLQDTRLAPNESIAGEVNFRLFEAAGCGAVVLGQDLGPEQAELFEPGREMFVCGDSLELMEDVRLLAGRPRLAEAVGRAAWERARRDHLPANRAATVLASMSQAPRAGAGPDAARWLALARAALLEAGGLPGETAAATPGVLAALPAQDGPVLAARLRVASALGADKAADAMLQRLCADAGPTDLAPLLAGSMYALRRVLAGDAAAFAPARSLAARAGVAAAPEAGPAAMLEAWSRRLTTAGRVMRGGFAFRPGRDLPDSALECLFWARQLAPSDTDVLRALAGMLARCDRSGTLRLGVLSELGLRAGGDWLPGLELGLCDLRLFRPEEGLGELTLAGRAAAACGRAEAFAARLAAADPSGRIRRLLAAE